MYVVMDFFVAPKLFSTVLFLIQGTVLCIRNNFGTGTHA